MLISILLQAISSDQYLKNRVPQKETELEKALKEAYTHVEKAPKKPSWHDSLGAGENSLEAKLIEGFSPEVKTFILKWAWIASLIMLVMGYLLIFFILFPEKRPF